MSLRRYEKFFEFEKVDEGDGLIWGWAIVCTTDDGEPYVDLQGDHIPVSAMLDAAAEFMTKSERPGLDMHAGEARGDIVFALPITNQTNKQLGVATKKQGLYIGWKPRDEAAMELAKSGDRLGFSIGGWIEDAEQVEVAKRADFAKAKSKAKDKPTTFRMFNRFHLDEISIVDRPAQEGALIGFVKRAVLGQRFGKAAVATSSDKGHQHVVDLTCIDVDGFGWTWSAETGKGAGYDGGGWHSHRVQRDPDTGIVKILDNYGHGHAVPDGTTAPAHKPPVTEQTVTHITMRDPNADAHAVSLTSTDRASSVTSKSHPSTEPSTMKTPEQIAALEADLKKSQTLASMNDAEKAYLATLGPTTGDAFLAKSAKERADELASDTVEYTATDGTVYRKSDGKRSIDLAKRSDKLEKDVAEERLARKRAEFAKQATEDMGALPGETAIHAAVIEAIDTGIADAAVKKAAFEAIRAGNDAMKKAAKTTGSTGKTKKAAGSDEAAGSQDSNVETLEKSFREKVAKYQADNKLASYEQALAKSTQFDPEIRDMYDELEEARAR